MFTYKIVRNADNTYRVDCYGVEGFTVDFGNYATEEEARAGANRDSIERCDLPATFFESTRNITKGQRNAVKRVVRFYKERDADNLTSVRFELRRVTSSLLSLTVNTRRSDCGKYSQRAILCERRAHFMIGPRGGLKLHNSDTGMQDDSQHVRYMLNASKA